MPIHDKRRFQNKSNTKTRFYTKLNDSNFYQNSPISERNKIDILFSQSPPSIENNTKQISIGDEDKYQLEYWKSNVK